MSVLDRTDIDNILCQLDAGGHIFNGYQLYKVNDEPCMLGKGGFSVVYKMVSVTNPEVFYAVKVMGFTRHTMSIDNFCETVQLQYALSCESDYVVRILAANQLRVVYDTDTKMIEIIKDIEKEQGMLLQFMLMELCEPIVQKDKFRQVSLVKNELNNEAEVLKFLLQIGTSVDTAHKLNILHRDIKLENIMWNAEDSVYKLGDFGMARYLEDGIAETVVYTDGYGAPEVAGRKGEGYNNTADIYSLGITAYLLLNDLKFPSSEGYYVNRVQYHPDYEFPAPKHASVPITRIIRKMCMYEPEDRYQTVSEVLEDLKEIVYSHNTSDDFVACDIATETYREDKITGDESYDELSDDWEYEEVQYSQKYKDKYARKQIRSINIKYIVVFSILIFLLMCGLETNTAIVNDWCFYILPAMIFIEALFLQAKEFHIIFGLATVAVGIWLMCTLDVSGAYILLLLSLATCSPMIIASGAIGTMIWMAVNMTGGLKWFQWIADWDISWLILVVALQMAEKILYTTILSKRVKSHMDIEAPFPYIIEWMYNYVAFAFILVGVLVGIIQFFSAVPVPEVLVHMHFIRVGVTKCMIDYIKIISYIRGSQNDTSLEE